jgi:hypothetical protein
MSEIVLRTSAIAWPTSWTAKPRSATSERLERRVERLALTRACGRSLAKTPGSGSLFQLAVGMSFALVAAVTLLIVALAYTAPPTAARRRIQAMHLTDGQMVTVTGRPGGGLA